jgi:hypothetical protein
VFEDLLIPERFPDCRIEPLPEDPGKIDLSCFPATLDPVTPGITVCVGEYSKSGGGSIRTLRGSSSGPVIWNGRHCTEIHWKSEAPGEKTAESTHWLDTSDQERIQFLMRYDRPAEGYPYAEFVESSFPKTVAAGDRMECTDRYVRGNRSAQEVSLCEIGPAFNVIIDSTVIPCLRMTSWTAGDDENRVETFIEVKSGRAVLVRRLKNQPEPEITRLWLCLWRP